MKKRTSTYILLFSVVAIWGFLGYRVYSALNPDIPLGEKHSEGKREKRIETQKPIEPYELNLNYPDPFGLTALKSKGHNSASTSVQVKETVPFPVILFKGTVSRTNEKGMVYLVQINSESFLFRVSETHENVTLIRGNKESILLEYQGMRKRFVLNE